jgi:hypothetical protein
MADTVLALTSPHMTGSVVTKFQQDMNTRLNAWDVPFQVAVDGDYGMESRDTAASLLYGLGVDVGGDFDGVSSTDRLKIRYGYDRLTATEQARHAERADWRKRYAESFGGGAVGVALRFARDHIGVTEHPPGSNQGPEIDAWARACGLPPSRQNFWCGMFVNACLHAAGFADQVWLRYCPSIEATAKAGAGGGWQWIRPGNVQPGDLVLYGSSEAEHVGIVEETASGVDTSTIEGNTSNGPGGSQSNGGIVARRHRHTDGSLNGFPIRGYARAPWR